MSRSERREFGPDHLLLVLALFVQGALLTLFVVPGIFTVDENNYLINVLALRHGRLTVANTAGLPPSRELLFFDPALWSRTVNSTPVASTAPPLYAPIALPFSWMGWRGLVALNTLAYLATAAMVFLYTRRYSSKRASPWLAMAAFAWSGFSIEYALGLWPHSLSVMLCTAGIFATGRLIATQRVGLAAVAGLLLAIAAGVRYQNVVVLATVGAGVFLWATPRWRSIATFSTAALVPLSISSAINHVRLQSWNPISKGPGYLSAPLLQDHQNSWFDLPISFWLRVVDYSARPVPPAGRFEDWVVHDPATGANLMLGLAQKKALLQSAPWMLIALVAFILVWLPQFRLPHATRKQLQLLSLVSVAVVGVFTLSGIDRDDGLSFNQRYFLELVPLAAVALGLALDELTLGMRPFIVGCVLAGAIVLAILTQTPMRGDASVPLWSLRQLALLKVPLILAVILGVVWTLRRHRPMVFALSAAVGACLTWALMLHLGDDMLVAQGVRVYNRSRTEALAALIPDHAALVAYWAAKDAAGPLLLDRDLVILDPKADDGADAPRLIQELLRRKRRVFFLDSGFPIPIRERILRGVDVTPTPTGGSVPLLELRGKHS